MNMKINLYGIICTKYKIATYIGKKIVSLSISFIYKLYKSHLVFRKFQRENSINKTVEPMVFTWFS